MQEVMARSGPRRALFDPRRASVATWLFTIARNRRIDAVRRQRRANPRTWAGAPTPSPRGSRPWRWPRKARGCAAAMTELPEAQAEMIRRAYWGDMSQGEIAAETGLPLGTIKSRIRLALQRLRQQMETER